METHQSPEKLFLKAYTRFYTSLKRTYLMNMEKARDKSYASTYFKRVLFAENKLIPHYSVFFHALSQTFIHYRKIGDQKPLEQTLSSVQEIGDLTSGIVESTMILHTLNYDSLEQLHWLYVQAIEDHNISVLELIDTEQRLLKYSTQKIILLLALSEATHELMKEYSDNTEESSQANPGQSEMSVEELIENKLTRSQQVLISYYISQLIGIKHKKNVSKCANALHTFLGIPYSQITHSELYKKLLNPLTFSSEKATIQNLLVVKSFFESIGSQVAVDLVNQDLERLKKNLE